MYLRLFFVYSGAVFAPLAFWSDPNLTQTGIWSGKRRKINFAACRSSSGRRCVLFCSFFVVIRRLP